MPGPPLYSSAPSISRVGNVSAPSAPHRRSLPRPPSITFGDALPKIAVVEPGAGDVLDRRADVVALVQNAVIGGALERHGDAGGLARVGDAVRPGAAEHRVRSGAAVDQIVAGAAGQGVGAVLPEQGHRHGREREHAVVHVAGAHASAGDPRAQAVGRVRVDGDAARAGEHEVVEIAHADVEPGVEHRDLVRAGGVGASRPAWCRSPARASTPAHRSAPPIATAVAIAARPSRLTCMVRPPCLGVLDSEASFHRRPDGA